MSEHTPLTEAERGRSAAALPDVIERQIEWAEAAATWPSWQTDEVLRMLLLRLREALRLDAARTSTATADTGLRERVEAAREQIRQQMLKAEFTDDRNTYGDGYGNGLAHALDFLRPALATPASTEDRADNEGTR